MSKKLSRSTYLIDNTVSIKASACVGGKKEGEGPMSKYFDKINNDPYFSTTTFEKAESEMQKQAIYLALRKAGVKKEAIDYLFGGDILNQCVSTTYGIRDLNIPFFGIYGACSAISEGILLSSLLLDNKVGSLSLCVTSSHFCTAERQYRFPIEYGGGRPPSSQWTATASGAAIISTENFPPYIRAVTIGSVTDMGVTDINNMGAAMAPAAYETIKTFFKDTKLSPNDFDKIVTGDLGLVGSRILIELLKRDNIDIANKHLDCGKMIFDTEAQDVHSGGSGCGCAGSMLCGYFVPQIKSGSLNNVLFLATGALMSPTVNQQGESIPSIAHALWLSYTKE